MKIIVLYFTLLTIAQQINFKCTPSTIVQTDFLIKNNQDTCPTNSHCLSNSFCECDDGFIGGCSQAAYKMQDSSEVSAQVSSDNYTFFQIKGSTQTYTLFSFNICLSGQTGITNFYIDVWDDNGTLDVFAKQNAEQGGKTRNIGDKCLSLNTPLMLFGTKTNGEVEGFIMGLKKVQTGTQTIKVKVQITQFDFWGLMVKVIFILGTCFLLVLTAAIIYVIFKWRRRQLFGGDGRREKDISHLDTYMPRIKLDKANNARLATQMCSICLIELGQTQFLRKTICSHIFHQDCLDSWCRTSLSCPVCRKSFELEDLKNQQQTFDRTEFESLRQGMLR